MGIEGLDRRLTLGRDPRGALRFTAPGRYHVRRVQDYFPAPAASRLVQEMIEEADRDQDGAVNAEEFYRIMRKREDPLDDLDTDDDDF